MNSKPDPVSQISSSLPKSADISDNAITFPKISERIFQSARSLIDTFEFHLLEILCEELDLIACSLYSVNPLRKSVSLRSEIGSRHHAHRSLAPAMASLAKLAFAEPAPPSALIAYMRDFDEYRNFATALHLGQVIVLPIHLSRVSQNSTASSICLLTKSHADEIDAKRKLDDLQHIIQLSFEVSMDFTASFLRNQLAEGATYASDASSFLHKVLHLLQAEWNFEAGSVFLFDRRARCLRLAATTGLDAKDTPKRHIYYRLTEEYDQTVRAFVDQRSLIIQNSDSTANPVTFREKTASPYHSALVSPLYYPPTLSRGHRLASDRCLGVLRLVNRQTTLKEERYATEFTWEDIELVNSLCTDIGVVTRLHQQVAQKGSDFERVAHGFETSVLTIIGALHNLNDNIEHMEVLPPLVRHSLPDAISFAESLHEQLRVFKMREIGQLENARFSHVRPFTDVISKIPHFAKNTARYFGVRSVSLDIHDFYEDRLQNLTGKRIARIPMVYTDERLLLAVFKNTIENAIKYCRADDNCFIKLRWRAGDSFVDILVSDAGIGVARDDEEFIFNEAYQGENAMRRRIQGTGVGLFQCRLIMERLHGSIKYQREIDDPEGLKTTFIVRIPRQEFGK